MKRVEHLISEVRARPVGNALNDNLIRELMQSTTLVPPDLSIVD